LNSSQLLASRAVGAEITYSFVQSTNRYEVALTFYYNCSSQSSVLNNYNISFSSNSCNQSGNFVVSKVSETLLNPSCKAEKNTCEGGTAFGFKKIVYKGFFAPPTACNDWIVSWVECNRNADISTIISPETNCLYIDALLNNLDAPENSSPVFTNNPLTIICVGEQSNINYGIFDSDKNRIEVVLTAPRVSKTGNVIFKSGFSPASPFTSVPQVSIATDGTILASPTTVNQHSVLSLKVNEYNIAGKLIASVTRDAQIIVSDCKQNKLPTLSGFNGTNDYSTSIGACVGQEHLFFLEGRDLNTKDKNVRIDFINSLGDSMFFFNGNFNKSVSYENIGNPNKIGVRWKPSFAELGVKSFVVSVEDSACPITGKQTYLYTITVNPRLQLQFPFTYKKIKDCIVKDTLNPVVVGGVAPYTYQWNSGESTASIIKSAGTYNLKVIDAKGCFAEGTVELDAGFRVDIVNLPSCGTKEIQFLGTTTAPNLVSSVSWNFGDGSFANQINPKHLYNTYGTFNVSLTAVGVNGCKVSAFKQTTLCEALNYQISIFSDSCESRRTDLCVVSSTKIGLLATNQYAKSCNPPNFTSWNFGNNTTLTSSSLSPKNVNYGLKGEYNITAKIKYEGCQDVTLTRKITIKERPTATISANNYNIKCNNLDSIIKVKATSTSFSPYTFRKDGVPNFVGTDYNFTVTSKGFYVVTITNQIGCSRTVCLLAEYPIEAFFATDDYCNSVTSTNFTNNTFSVYPLSTAGWSFGDGAPNATSLNVASHKYKPDSLFLARLIVKDIYGCADTAFQTVSTYLPFDTLKIEPIDKLCFREPILFSGPKGKSISFYSWNFGEGEIRDSSFNDVATDSLAKYGNPARQRKPKYQVNASSGYYIPSFAGRKKIGLTITYNNTCKKSYSDSVVVFKISDIGVQTLGKKCASNNLTISGIELAKGEFPIRKWQFDLFRDTFPVPTFVDTTKTGLPFSYNVNNSFQFNFIEQDNNLLRIRTEDNNPIRICYTDSTFTYNIKNVKAPAFTFNDLCLNSSQSYLKAEINDIYQTQDSLVINFGDGSINTFSGKLTQNLFHNYSTPGQFLVNLKVIDLTNNCSDSIQKTITVAEPPKVEFNAGIACENQPLQLLNLSRPFNNNNPIKETAWYILNDTIKNAPPNFSYNFKNAKSFAVKLSVRDSLGCLTEKVQSIVVSPSPEAVFAYIYGTQSGGTTVNFEDKSLTGSSAATISKWSWKFDDGDTSNLQNPTHSYQSVQLFTPSLLVTNNFGCESDTSLALDLSPFIKIPTAFSPNGDNVNDELYLFHNGIKLLRTFKIFNRYGQVVFETSNLNSKWDGTFNGQELPSGVYQYFATAESVFGFDVKPIQGNLMLVR